MNKKVAVLFSGGLDSTYLIWKNLKDGNEVTPIYVEIENNKVKSIIEKNRIELLYKKFLEEFRGSFFGESKIKNIEYVVNVNIKTFESNLQFSQMPVWIFALLFCQNLDVDEFQIGYVMNDDAISYLDDIQNIYKSYEAISLEMKPLVFPLTKMKKYQMANVLPKQYFDLIFSCENATIIGPEDGEIIQYEPCCECVPCSHIIESNYYNIGRFPENYKKNLLKHHANILVDMGCKVLTKDGEEFRGWGDVSSVKAPDMNQLTIEFPGSMILEHNDEIETDEHIRKARSFSLNDK
jgi:7-cyano-7-deazaguanine synthase in queuosine biosynthesis